ncbi:guanine nucleotide exchange factor subunit Rich isoform X2 [Macrosteles quadrilineatus]|uniref:guanine nucleotide exchange factor subunit Rich isoform X2 n=1 Tax=Macrosteles quadrilineatus TaxID=74068 RepID=UPI0023E138A1|nr:guanine nucleotide exchange factor subunit Rich isoform X2 [Macrosteles quadrilineatus]
MYFALGWPKVLNLPHLNNCSIRQVICNRDKTYFAILSDDTLSIFFCKPCLPITLHRRSHESVEDIGMNESVEWRPDSSMLVVATSGGFLVYYHLTADSWQKGLYEQVDSPQPNLRRDSAELFVKEVVPPLQLSLGQEVAVGGGILSMVCMRDELMVSTTRGHVLRYRWDCTQNRDYCLDLRRIPFCIDQQVSKAVPIVQQNTYITHIDYSPLNCGFAVVFNDGRAAFLIAPSYKFDPNQVQGIWAPNIDDATCATVNHKYRLITFGRKNSHGAVFCMDESSGGLELCHELSLSPQVYPGEVGPVCCLRWTPDGCAMAMAWSRGGFSVWSTFGALLVCSLGWDYGLHVDLARFNPLNIVDMEWSLEGYQLWMVKRHDPGGNNNNNSENNTNNNSESANDNTETTPRDTIIQLGFVKSALTVNPCMSRQTHLYLQGEDRLYVNLSPGLTKVYEMRASLEEDKPLPHLKVTSALVENKQWLVILLPSLYSATNWPIRYTAVDSEGSNIAVAGKNGLAHYSLSTKRWKLFGNETQEKDMMVMGGLLWWQQYIVAGCYSSPDEEDQIRIYPRDMRLSNEHMTMIQLSAQIFLLDCLQDRLLVYSADGQINIFTLQQNDNSSPGMVVDVRCIQRLDMNALLVHPACVVSVTLTALRTEPTRREDPHYRDSFLLNISGRLLMVSQNNNQHQVLAPPQGLASCVENVWVPGKFLHAKPHLTEALWLFCGAQGMRVWLPLFPRDGDKSHTFMSKRIMLPFQLRIYPLAILFEEAILLGAENDTMLYTSDSNSPFSLPFCTLERTSQVYLHQILRQLIRRNLGFHAWEIARGCSALPYFSHSLELLLHEVLEEEATSKEPIPDAQLPSVVEFIQEFPVYLETIVQCARKTEIALWPYLFAAAGKPKDLFHECLVNKQLDTAASYLIILQNMESSTVSRQYATMLLDSTLESGKWELSKDLVRFLKAIDPNDAESADSPRTSFIHANKYGVPQPPPVNPNEEDLSLVLGSMQVSRGRSFSTTVNPKLQMVEPMSHAADVASLRRKKSVPTAKSDNRSRSCISTPGAGGGSAEEFFMDVMVQRHARRLLCDHRLGDLGRLSAHLDFPLVGWLARERDRAARVDHFVTALKDLHSDFNWPFPTLVATQGLLIGRKTSATSGFNKIASNDYCPTTTNSYGYMSSAMSTPTLDERMRGLSVEVPESGSRVGDSGYMSQDPLVRPIDNPQLMPHLADERSIVSDSESWWCGEDWEQCTSDSWSDIPSVQLLEQISQEVSANKGSSKAEVQLRYLLQILMEAGCLEWSLLISILLRDAMAVHRTTNAARSVEHTYEAVIRLKEGLLCLYHWSNTECLGYKPFMMAIHNQAVVLSKLLSTKPPPTPVSPPPPKARTPPIRSRTTSGSSIHSETITEPNTEVEEEELEDREGRTSPSPSTASSHTEPTSCSVS